MTEPAGLPTSMARGEPDLTVLLQSVSGDLRIRRALPGGLAPHGG